MENDKSIDWILINIKIGALSFGSAGRALLYRDAVVNEKKWLTSDEFQEVMTITQILPGPNLVNLSAYLGYRLTGKLGTLGGVLGLAAPGALMLVTCYNLLGLGNPSFESFFKGVSIGSVCLFFLLIWKMLSGLSKELGTRRINFISKRNLRLGVAIIVATLALTGTSISTVILVGMVLGLVTEFLT